MRLKWGPHASQLAEQVVLRDPSYVVHVLGEQPGGVLAEVFRDLILSFDARPPAVTCARCRRKADGLYAYPASVQIFGVCERCALSQVATLRPAQRLGGYEDAVRHVAMSYRRAHRLHMRRIITSLAQAKGAAHPLTAAAALAFFFRE